ncbi:phage tail protein [Amycolatopsis anabasis]|uniref:phage tail protein n=1 Tax=Amycolatopsis anabasis TaxID=1840409 RepID=UPI00131B58C4|nr:hypothetical protein [Amycolatopsis anabasis]
MAKGPGTKGTIGKVGVRVVPESERFREELRAQLEAALKGFKVKIPVELDVQGASVAAARLRTAIEGNPIKQKVGIDTQSFNVASRSIARMRFPLTGIGKLIDSMAQGLRNAGSSADRLARSLVNTRRQIVSAVSQTAVWAGQMLRHVLTVENAWRAWVGLARAIAAVDAAIMKIPSLALLARDLALAGASAAKLAGLHVGGFFQALVRGSTYANLFYRSMERVAVFGARTADSFDRLRRIKLSDVANGVKNLATHAANGVRHIGRLGVTMGRTFSRGVGKSIDGVVTGIGRSIRNGLSGASNILGNVAQGFTKISTTSMILGGLMAVIAPAVALVAGLLAGLPSLLLAIGAAAGVVYLGWDGVKRAFGDFKDAIGEIKHDVADVFEQGLTPQFQALGQVVIQLKPQILEIARALSTFMQGFTNVFTSVKGMEQLRTILQNTAQFFTALQPMVEAFFKAFLTLGEAGSRSFGTLAQVLNNFAITFNAMVDRLNQTGALKAAFEGLAQVTGSLLGFFVRLFEVGVQAMGQLGDPLATLINGFANAFIALMPALTAFSSLVANVLGAVFEAITPAISALTPAFTMLASTVGTLLVGAIQAVAPILSALAQIIGQVVLTALQAIQPYLPQIVTFMTQLGQTVGQFLTAAFMKLTPFLGMAADFLGKVLEAVMPLLPAILQLVQAGLDALLQIMTPLIPPLLQLAQAIMPVLVQVIQALTPVILLAVDALTQLMPIFADVVNAITSAVMPVFNGILQVVKDVFPGIKDIIDGVLKVITGIIKTVLSIIKGDWSGAWDGIKQILSGAWDAIKGAIKTGFDFVVSFFKNVPGKILEALGNLGGLLWDVGSDLLKGLWNGISSAGKWLLQKVGEFFGNLLPGWVKRMLGIASPSRVFAAIGRWIPPGLAQGIDSTANQAVTATRDLASRVVDGFSLNGDARAYGKAVTAEWAKGISDGTPAAMSAVDGMSRLLNKTATAEWEGLIKSEDFGSIGDKVAEALEGWSVQVDKFGQARMVRSAESRNKFGR